MSESSPRSEAFTRICSGPSTEQPAPFSRPHACKVTPNPVDLHRPQERFTNNLHNSIYWRAECNRGRGRYRNRNRERRRHLAFGQEKLDVYRAAIASVGGAYRYCEKLKGHRNAKDQRLRVSQAMALKTVEGKGPRVTAKRLTGTDAGILKSHEVRRWSALRLRTCCRFAMRCPQTTTGSRRYCSMIVWVSWRSADSVATRSARRLRNTGSVRSIYRPQLIFWFVGSRCRSGALAAIRSYSPAWTLDRAEGGAPTERRKFGMRWVYR